MTASRVRYLNQWEKAATRSMYEAAFPEDSREFVDYYYKWKTKDNEILVMEGAEDDSSFHVMIQMNPYALSIHGTIKDIPYIVAVATDSQHRRQGKMRQVMETSLQDMQRKEIPFTFLLPANPSYYKGQGFVYFPCQDYLKTGGICLRETPGYSSAKEASAEQWRYAVTVDGEAMASFANRVLSQRCGVFIRRDSYYYRRLLEELKAEHGGILLSETEHEIHKIIPYSISSKDGRETAEIKEFLSEQDSSKEEAGQICREGLEKAGCTVDSVNFTASRMMVRLTNLTALVPLLRSETPIRYEGKVTDSIIEANNGCYRIEIGRRGGSIRKIEEKEAKGQIEIAQLAERLFQGTAVYLNEWV